MRGDKVRGLKILVIGVLCILAGFFLGFLNCQKCEVAHVSPSIYGLPLSKFWNLVLKKTKASNESILNWFYVETDENGNLNHLILEFTDVKARKTYHIEYLNGKISYYSAKAENVKGLHPMTIFRELEKLNFKEILKEYPYKGFVIDIGKESGDVGYDSNYTKIYLLSNGSLIPLKDIVFHSENPWYVVRICKIKYVKNESVVESRSVKGITAFLPYDLDKAMAKPLINVTPKAGDYIDETKILLKEVKLTLCKLKEACPPSKDRFGIEVRGLVRNDYDKDYYVCLHAITYDSNGNIIERSVDYGPICGLTVLHLKSGEEREFSLHLKLKEEIAGISIGIGCLSEVPPP